MPEVLEATQALERVYPVPIAELARRAGITVMRMTLSEGIDGVLTKEGPGAYSAWLPEKLDTTKPPIDAMPTELDRVLLPTERVTLAICRGYVSIYSDSEAFSRYLDSVDDQ